MELESVFEEPSILGSPLSNYVDSYKVVIVFPEADVLPGVLQTTWNKLHGTSSPPNINNEV